MTPTLTHDRGTGTVFDAVDRHRAPRPAPGQRHLGRDAHEVTAYGATVQLSDGREVIDFGSPAVTLLGHRPDRVVAAVRHQLARMPTTTKAVTNPVVAGFAEELLQRCGARLDRAWVGSDGADAVEIAVKLARRSTGRPRVLAVRGGFHGATLGALALTWSPAFRAGLDEVLHHVTHIPPDDPEAVARETRAGDVAALIVEPIQGEYGIRPLAEPVLARWALDAHAAGAFVLADEVQVGLRRCGPFSVALRQGWRPDAVLFGTALGGGVLPLAAVAGTAQLFEPLHRDPAWHSAAFGGHPLACAAGRAALRAVDEFVERGRQVGETVGHTVRALAGRHPDLVADVRGHGLLWGMELHSPTAADAVRTALADRGLLVSPCLGSPRTLRLAPPMVTTERELARALDALDGALTATRPAETTGGLATRRHPGR